MTTIRLLPTAEADLDRLAEFLRSEQPVAAAETSGLIVRAVDILAQHPLIGRATSTGLRELVISRGRSGYLALYDFNPVTDTVYIIGIRHQREAGYPQ